MMLARLSITYLRSDAKFARLKRRGDLAAAPLLMAAPKIKKKTSSTKASAVPRQGAIPCLIVVGLIVAVVIVLLYFSLRSAG